jgi:hypothetical protein
VNSLAAGAIGSLLTAGLAFGARIASIPRECASHDRAVIERDEDLAQWVSDDHLRLTREIRQIKNELAARGMLSSGEYGYLIGLAKEGALQAYRDQERQATRDVARIYETEGWLHSLWRVASRKKRATLDAPQRVQPILDSWRLPVGAHLTDTPAPILDPTRRNLEDTLEKVATGTEDLV